MPSKVCFRTVRQLHKSHDVPSIVGDLVSALKVCACGYRGADGSVWRCGSEQGSCGRAGLDHRAHSTQPCGHL